MNYLSYLEDAGERLSRQLVVNNGEEFAERPQEGGGLDALLQQILYGGQDVHLCLLERGGEGEREKGERG